MYSPNVRRMLVCKTEPDAKIQKWARFTVAKNLVSQYHRYMIGWKV